VSAASARAALARAGLSLSFERDPVVGYEFLVSDASGQTVAYGYCEGGKKEAAQEALRHPVVQLKLAAVSL
jgi:hypothetical protein